MPGISAWHPLSGLLRAGSNGFSQSVASGQGGGVFYRSNVHIIFKVLRIDHKGMPYGDGLAQDFHLLPRTIRSLF